MATHALLTNRFVWADLSSYDVAAAERFYGGVWGWDFADGEVDGYRFALHDDKPVAAVYPMPEKFAKIKMPPFWMSYVAVENAAQTARAAGENGGKVEVLDRFGNGEMALIRDPSGAGFSVYDGDGIVGSRAAGINPACWYKFGYESLGLHLDYRVPPIFHSVILGYELFVPDAEVVRGFYENVFGWGFVAEGGGRFNLTDESGGFVAAVQEAADDIRGNKQYWAVHFAVTSLAHVCDLVKEYGGSVWDKHEKHSCFAASPGGEFFILSEQGLNRKRRTR